MHDAVRELGLRADNQLKIDGHILPFLESEWQKRGLPDSGKLLKAMATMLREPHSQRGRALSNKNRDNKG
jgi:hypothetical protein